MIGLQQPTKEVTDQLTPTPTLAQLGVRAGDKIAASLGYDYRLRLNQAHEVTWADVRTFRGTPPPSVEFVIAAYAPGTPDNWDGTAYGFHYMGGNVEQNWALWQRG
jgi:hypothetical protein